MKLNKIAEILLELRSASKFMYQNQTEEYVKSIMRKHDMLMVGEKFNTIYSNEFAHSLVTVHKIQINNDELTAIIPGICSTLGMNCEPMYEVSDISNPNRKIACYQIILW